MTNKEPFEIHTKSANKSINNQPTSIGDSTDQQTNQQATNKQATNNNWISIVGKRRTIGDPPKDQQPNQQTTNKQQLGINNFQTKNHWRSTKDKQTNR